jgi:O-antigen/teichoic acid export membrane protein
VAVVVRRKSTLFDVSTTLLTRILILVGNFIVSIITARILGPEGKGLFAAITVIPGLVLAFSDFGIGHSAAYMVGRKTHRNEEVASSLLVLWILTSLFAVAVTAILYAVQFGSEYWMLLVLMLLVIPCDLGMRYMKGYLQGKERIGIMNSVDLYRVALNIILVLLLVGVFRTGVMGMLLTTLIMALVICMVCVISVSRDVKLKIRFLKQLSFEMFVKGIAFAAAILMLQLNLRIDLVMLESMTTIYEVGIYSLGTNVAELIWQIPTAVGMVLFARSANSKTVEEAVQRTAKMIRLIVPVLLVAGTIFWGIMPVFVHIVYGAEYLPSVEVIRLLLPGVICMVIVKILHSDISGRGKPLYTVMLVILPLIINLAANWLLIPSYGAAGAAVSSTISYSVACVLFLVGYAFKEKISLSDLLMIKKTDIEEIWKQLGRFKPVRKAAS